MSSLRAKSFAELFTFSRAGTAYYVDSAGLLVAAATDVPRWDYDPVTLALRGLLIEPPRTNLCLRSQEFDNASWTAISAKNVSANSTAAPDGTTTADTLTDSSAIAYEGIAQSVTVANDSLVRTVSLYVRKTSGGTAPTFGLNVALSGGTPVNANVRLNTDTGAILSGTAETDRIGDYWRLTAPVTNNTSGNTTLAVSLYPATAAYGSGTDVVGATGSAVIWGAQIETGEASSYIPTTTVSVARARDVASTTVLSPWFNAPAGTLVLEGSLPWTYNAGDPSSRILWEVDDGTTNNRHLMYWAYGYVQASGYKAGNLSYDSPTYQPTKNVPWRQALAWAANDVALVGNGGAGNGLRTDTAADMPTGLTTFRLGATTAAGFEPNMHFRGLKYYPRRMSNNDLVALSRVA